MWACLGLCLPPAAGQPCLVPSLFRSYLRCISLLFHICHLPSLFFALQATYTAFIGLQIKVNSKNASYSSTNSKSAPDFNTSKMCSETEAQRCMYKFRHMLILYKKYENSKLSLQIFIFVSVKRRKMKEFVWEITVKNGGATIRVHLFALPTLLISLQRNADRWYARIKWAGNAKLLIAVDSIPDGVIQFILKTSHVRALGWNQVDHCKRKRLV